MHTVLVPGFTQTAASWDGVRAALPPGTDATSIDVPLGLDFVATAAAIGAAGGCGEYAGYSMGGRLCLRLALDRPDLVERLVLISASTGIADTGERSARRQADDALADEIEHIGAEAFLRRWLAQPMFATVPSDAPGLAERAAFTAAQLAQELRDLGTGVQAPLWDRLGALAMPVTIVTGTLDAKFDTIGDAMAERIPNVVRVRIEGGHALPLEAPADLAALIA